MPETQLYAAVRRAGATLPLSLLECYMPLALRFCTFLGSRTVLRLETALLQQEQTDSRSCRNAERADVRQPSFCDKASHSPQSVPEAQTPL